jgi:iron-sulfur cluster insertion protein
MKYIDEVTMSLTLTDAAADKIAGLLENEDNSALNLRIFVSGGGCSGFQYGFTFDDEIKESDEVVDSHGVKLLVDPMSLELINGAEVDYQSSVNGESFVIRNPNAGSSCGCGKSFTPAETGTGCANNTGY